MYVGGVIVLAVDAVAVDSAVLFGGEAVAVGFGALGCFAIASFEWLHFKIKLYILLKNL